MRNLKRALSLALALVMVLSMMVVGASAVSADDFSDSADIVNKEAVTVLATLGVITGNDDGSYAPADTISRAEMSTIICRVLNGGKDPVLGESVTNTYTDTASHWAKNYIEYCTTLGIVAGKGDGTFDPEGDVTVAEAAKMVLVALGYNAGVEGYTGANWQINTDARANPLGLYDGLDYTTTSAALTRDNAAQMLYNALDCRMVTYDYIITGNVQDAITTKPQLNDRDLGTLLWEKFGAVKVEGVVIANEFANLTATNVNGDKDTSGAVVGTHLDADRTRVEVTNEDEQSLFSGRETFVTTTGEVELGKGVYLYVKPASNSTDALKATVIGSVIISDANEIVTDASGDTAEEVADDNNLELTGDTQYVYNYAEMGAAPKANKDGWAGIQKTLVDTDSDGDVDYVLYKEMGLGKVSLYTTAKDGQISVSIHDGYRYLNDDSADVVGFEDVAKDDYVLAAYFGGRLYVQVAETVTGTINAYKQTGSARPYRNTAFTIDETPYDVSRVHTYTGDLYAAVTEVDKTILESDATFYLDLNGYVIAYGEVDESAYKYAFIWGAENGATNLDDDRVRATLEDGSTKVYSLDSNSEIDIVDGNGALHHVAGNDYTIGEEIMRGLVFAYTLTSDGEIKLSLPRGGAVKSADADSHPTFTNGLTNIRFLDGTSYEDAVVENNLKPNSVTPTVDSTYYSNNATTFFYVTYDETDPTVIDKVDVYNGRNAAPTLDGKSGTALLALNARGTVGAAVFTGVDVAESAGDHMFIYNAGFVWSDYGYVDAYFNGDTTAQEDVRVALYLNNEIEHNPTVLDGLYLYRYNNDGYYELTDLHYAYAAGDAPSYYFEGTVLKADKNTSTFTVLDDSSDFRVECKITADSVLVDYASSSSSPVAYTDTNVTEGDKVRIIVNNAKDCEVLTVAVMERPEMGGGFEDTNLNIHFTGTTVTATWTGTNEPSLDNIITRIENEIKAMGYDGVTVTRSYTGTQLVYNFTPYRLIGGVEVPAGNTYEYNTVTGLSKELMIKVNGKDVDVTSNMKVEDAFGGAANVRGYVLDENGDVVATTDLVEAGKEYTDNNIKLTVSGTDYYGLATDKVADEVTGTLTGNWVEIVAGTSYKKISELTYGDLNTDTDYDTEVDPTTADGFYKLTVLAADGTVKSEKWSASSVTLTSTDYETKFAWDGVAGNNVVNLDNGVTLTDDVTYTSGYYLLDGSDSAEASLIAKFPGAKIVWQDGNGTVLPESSTGRTYALPGTFKAVVTFDLAVNAGTTSSDLAVANTIASSTSTGVVVDGSDNSKVNFTKGAIISAGTTVTFTGTVSNAAVTVTLTANNT